MFANEIDADGRPICLSCGKSVMPNDELPNDSDQRGTGALTAAGDIVIIHKSCAQALGLA